MMTKKRLSNSVKADPLENLPDGYQLKFEPKFLYPETKMGINSVKNWEISEGIILATSFTDETGNEVDGCAVLVAPGVAICATHVIESRMADIANGKIKFTCFGINSDGLTIWIVRKVTIIPNTDFAILGIQLASDLPTNKVMHLAAISTRTPMEGEDLLLCGFKSSKKRFELEPNSTTWSSDLFVSQGNITNRFPSGRDKTMIPWPALEVNSLVYGGMSGGPVFDKNGHLTGLICSSIELDEGQGISYISQIWPVLAQEFEAVWPKGIYYNKTDLLSLTKLCFIDKRDAIAIERDRVNDLNHIKYLAWE